MPLSLETVEYSSSAVTLPDFPAICISALNEAIASLASAIALDAFEPNAVMTSPALFTLPLLSTILFLNFTTWSLNFEYESRPLAFELLFSSLSICRIVSINCTPDTLVCLRLSEAFLAPAVSALNDAIATLAFSIAVDPSIPTALSASATLYD